MTVADVLDFVARFQILLASLVAIGAAGIAYRGATAPVREARKRDRAARRDRQLGYLLALDEALWDRNSDLMAMSNVVKKLLPPNVQDFAPIDLGKHKAWLDTPPVLQAYWDHIEHVPLAARALLRRYAHKFVICRIAMNLTAMAPDTETEVRWHEFVADVDELVDRGAGLRKALAPTLDRLLLIVPDHHAP